MSTFWACIVALTLLPSGFALTQSAVTREARVDPMDPTVSLADSSAPIPRTGSVVVMPAWQAAVSDLPVDRTQAEEETFHVDAVPALIAVGVSTGGLLLIDHRAYEATNRMYRSSPTSRRVFDGLRFAGDGRAALGVAASFALVGAFSGDRRALSVASHTTEALIASGVVVQLLKRVAGRESPGMASRPSGRWRPFPGWNTYNRSQARYYSFPSGHVTTTMAMVTVIANEYPEIIWIRPAGYALVGLVGVSLVSTGWHWYSDFPLACAIGYVFGNLVSEHHPEVSRFENPDIHASLDVRPVVTSRGAGLGLVYSF